MKKYLTRAIIAVLMLVVACEASTTEPSVCCRVCRKGKACGNSCIARDRTCRKGVGCACNGLQVLGDRIELCRSYVSRGLDGGPD